MREFRAFETTHFAVGQPSINLRVPSDNQSKIDKDLQQYANCFCTRRITFLTSEMSGIFAGNDQLLFSN